MNLIGTGRGRRCVLAALCAPVLFTIGYGAAQAGQGAAHPDPELQALQQIPVNPALPTAAAQLDEKTQILTNTVHPAGDDDAAALAAKSNAPHSYDELPWAASGKAEEQRWKPEEGVFEEKSAPYPASEIQVSNRWSGEVDGRHFDVYVGARPSDAGLVGAVLVVPWSFDGQPGEPQMLVGRGMAPLRAVSAEDGGVRLVDSEGRAQHLRLRGGPALG